MTRKRCHRRATVPLPPPGLRPRLSSAQVRDLGLVHTINLDAIARGEADEGTLWQWVGGVLTWSRVSELLQLGAPEMKLQLDLAERVVERYRRTQHVLFSGPDYQLAKDGVVAIVDVPTATAAADWSEATLEALASAVSGTGATHA
jgi:hypothetical protein